MFPSDHGIFTLCHSKVIILSKWRFEIVLPWLLFLTDEDESSALAISVHLEQLPTLLRLCFFVCAKSAITQLTNSTVPNIPSILAFHYHSSAVVFCLLTL